MKNGFAIDEERERILALEKAHRDRISLLASARDEGWKIGFQEGLEEAYQEGFKEGLGESVDALIDLRFGEQGARLKTLAQSATLEQLSAAMAAVRSASLAEMEALLMPDRSDSLRGRLLARATSGWG